MKAIVLYIQVGGVMTFYTLEDACREYIRMVDEDDGFRSKIHFAIKLPDGQGKFITIRDEDSETVAYGSFAGLPSFLDFAQELDKEHKEKND